MKVSDYVVAALYQMGVRHVFELSGGMITHLLDSLYLHGKIRIVSMHHEQAAAFAADATGRMTGIPGVAMATSGPGATNLLTGIGSCYFDSSPGVFITGQVNRSEQKGDRKIRQLGFQETDIVAMAGPITKEAWRITAPEEVPPILARAFRVATGGRPGPVLIDIPMDVQRSSLDGACLDEQPPASEGDSPTDCGPLRDALLSSRRPMFLVGGGIRAGHAQEMFLQLVNQLGVPVVNSLMAVDVLPYGHPSRVGMIGTYGNRWANLALAESDLVVVMGSRLDVRQTGSRTDAFKGDRKIFHIDCEEAELNNRVKGCDGIVSALGPFLEQLLSALRGVGRPFAWAAWLDEIEGLRRAWPDTAELKSVVGINPNSLMHQLSDCSAAAYVADVGQHQMWAAQSLELGPRQRFLTSGGMGSMGFGLPAAIGVALSVPGKPVVLIAGDGGFQCNIQELQTVVQLGLPLKIVVLNNQCHGMVRQFQESYFEGRYQSTWWGYSAPDFASVATAYGVCGRTVADEKQVPDSLRWLWEDPDQPRLLQVMIDPLANAYPKVAFGQPISEMEPFGKPVDIEST
jgi:acetolactate synthase-1/2/3 large subunit